MCIRDRVRTVASFPRVPKVSFVSSEIRSGRSCKPDSEFGGCSANQPNLSDRSVRSLWFREFPNASVRLRKKYKAGRARLFCSLAPSFRSYVLVLMCLLCCLIPSCFRPMFSFLRFALTMSSFRIFVGGFRPWFLSVVFVSPKTYE